ncbi:MAG: hypothetical protein RXP27_06355 [Nitrososphaeria archaeon]
MRRRAQASIVAALFVIIALMILAVGFANVLTAQQSYVNQFQQSVQEDQLRSAESLTVLCSMYSNGTYAINVTDNSPFASEVLRVYYYNSTAFGWSWANRSVGPGSTVTINVNPGGSWGTPQFAVVTALGNVFTCARPPAPSTSLPAPAVYSGSIWGGDEYSYSQVGDSVSRVVSGKMFLWNSTSSLSPWTTWTAGSVSTVVIEDRYEILMSPSPGSSSALRYSNTSWYYTSAVIVLYLRYAPSSVSGPPPPSPSTVIVGISTNPSSSLQNVPQGYGANVTTYDQYTASYASIISATGSKTYAYNQTRVWFSPYNYHVIKFVANAASNTYVEYLDGVLRSYYHPGGSSSGIQGIYVFATTAAQGDRWYVATVSAYTNDTITVYNVPPGGTVEIIGRDAIGRPVFLEGVNSLGYPSAVSINIDNYYAPITGELVVTP